MRKRDLASLVYTRRIDLFDRLNLNTIFRDVVRGRFANSMHIGGRIDLHSYVHDSKLKDQPVTYLEFGVWKGASITHWAELSTDPASRFYGFDTFTGLPESWNKLTPQGSFDLKGVAPVIGDRRVTLVPGLFQKSLYPFLTTFAPRRPIVVHIDCDLYSSALFVLAAMDRVMLPGSILIFDEFWDLQHEFAAFMDYTQSFYREWDVLTHTSNYVQVAVELA